MLQSGDIPSSNMEVKQDSGASLVRSDLPADEILTSGPHQADPNDEIKTPTPSVRENGSFANVPDTDGVSTLDLAQSTFSGYTPSSLERKGLLGGGRRATLQDPSQITRGRKAFVGVCKAMDVIIPLDINEEATSMQDSGLAKLARAVKRKEELRRQQRELAVRGPRSHQFSRSSA